MAKIIGIAGLGQTSVEVDKAVKISTRLLAEPKYSQDLIDLLAAGPEHDMGAINLACAKKLPDEVLQREFTEKELDRYIDCNRVAVGLEPKYTSNNRNLWLLAGAGVLLAGVWWMSSRRPGK